MKNILIDTNIALLAIREGEEWKRLWQSLGMEQSTIFFSVVSIGELRSIALRNSWGNKRIAEMEKLMSEFVILDINIEVVIRQYARIDAFSQGKLKDMPLGISSRNMGKNDLWIAASASAFQLTLLTTDHDFDHLHPDFLPLQVVSR
jgi:tRNA(fMet)-specific endonuclease VapC